MFISNNKHNRGDDHNAGETRKPVEHDRRKNLWLLLDDLGKPEDFNNISPNRARHKEITKNTDKKPFDDIENPGIEPQSRNQDIPSQQNYDVD